MAITIGEALLTGERQHMIDMTASGRYMIGGTWYGAEINSAAIQQNGAVHITFYARGQDTALTPATRFQLLNTAGDVLAEREETISFTSGLEEILIRFKLGLSVGTDEEV